jgi:hypothetical protein
VHTAEMKGEEEVPTSDGDKLRGPKAPDNGQSERACKKDIKVKRSLSSTAVRPGVVALPEADAATREINVPQTTQLREPGEVTVPSHHSAESAFR